MLLLDDGKLQTESDSGEFWVTLGGFAPIGKKAVDEDDVIPERTPPKLYRYSSFCLCCCPMKQSLFWCDILACNKKENVSETSLTFELWKTLEHVLEIVKGNIS